MLAGLGAVADIDFCEYIEQGIDRKLLADSFIRVVSLDEAEIFCARGRVIGSQAVEVSYPNGDAARDAFRTIAVSASHGKFDFVAGAGPLGILEATNLTLMISRDRPNEGAATRSFPLQEAPISTSSNWVPRSLDSRAQLGIYIEWLRGEVATKLQHAEYVKAAKRGLSLARLLFLEKEADSIVDCLASHDLATVAALQARMKLARSLESLPEKANLTRQLKDWIAAQLLKIGVSGENLDAKLAQHAAKGFADLQRILEQLVTEVNALFPDNTMGGMVNAP